jgi:O-antigen biosynthesis protein WbqP
MRILDFLIAVSALVVFAPVFGVVWLMVRLTSAGPALYWSRRVGLNNQLFDMPKFRTMQQGAPVVATHEFSDPDAWLTPIGGFLRRSSLDELPQLWTIMIGKMAIVGPRPALFNQVDLIALRTNAGVHVLKPGLTGWAQVNGRDEVPIPMKVAFDVEYLNRRSLIFDAKIILMTVGKVFSSKNVAH